MRAARRHHRPRAQRVARAAARAEVQKAAAKSNGACLGWMDGLMTRARLRDVQTGATRDLAATGIFIFVGFKPNYIFSDRE